MILQAPMTLANYLIGRLTKDQEVTYIWPVSELLNAYINVFFVKFET